MCEEEGLPRLGTISFSSANLSIMWWQKGVSQQPSHHIIGRIFEEVNESMSQTRYSWPPLTVYSVVLIAML